MKKRGGGLDDRARKSRSAECCRLSRGFSRADFSSCNRRHCKDGPTKHPPQLLHPSSKEEVMALISIARRVCDAVESWRSRERGERGDAGEREGEKNLGSTSNHVDSLV